VALWRIQCGAVTSVAVSRAVTCGVVALWRRGVWRCGAVALWRCGGVAQPLEWLCHVLRRFHSILVVLPPANDFRRAGAYPVTIMRKLLPPIPNRWDEAFLSKIRPLSTRWVYEEAWETSSVLEL
jgi:hypothetical protein